MSSSKILLRSTLGLSLCSLILSFSSCSDEPSDNFKQQNIIVADASIDYTADGLWTGWNENNDLKIGDFMLTHGWAGYAYGFTAAKQSDNQNYPDEMFDHQFTVMPGGGPKGIGTPYIVGYWDAYQESAGGIQKNTCEIRLTSDKEYAKPFYPQSIKVTNSCYTYYVMRDGSAFSKQFEQGDWLRLDITGRLANGSTATESVYLADCKGRDSSEWFLTDWKEVDLTKLGCVQNLVFTLVSSDNSIYGMNTPAYFGIADLKTLVEN